MRTNKNCLYCSCLLSGNDAMITLRGKACHSLNIRKKGIFWGKKLMQIL